MTASAGVSSKRNQISKIKMQNHSVKFKNYLNADIWQVVDVVAGGSLGDRRNEETYSKYAVGARIKQHPSRRQQQRGNCGGLVVGGAFFIVFGAFKI